MIDTPELIEVAPQQTASIHVTVARAAIRSVMGPTHQELMRTVAAQGLTPAGPWFTQHLRVDPAEFDFELGVPLDSPIAPAGRVRPGALPAGRIARTLHHGAYEGLAESWGTFRAWLGAEGYTPGAGVWESYLVGPESGPDAAVWRTQLNWPLGA